MRKRKADPSRCLDVRASIYRRYSLIWFAQLPGGPVSPVGKVLACDGCYCQKRQGQYVMWCSRRKKKGRLSNFQRASLVQPSLQSDPAYLCNNIQGPDLYNRSRWQRRGPASLRRYAGVLLPLRCEKKVERVWIRAEGPLGPPVQEQLAAYTDLERCSFNSGKWQPGKEARTEEGLSLSLWLTLSWVSSHIKSFTQAHHR